MPEFSEIFTIVSNFTWHSCLQARRWSIADIPPGGGGGGGGNYQEPQ